MEICFVCTGNASRSPMAEAIARSKIEDLGLPWPVFSAGTEGVDGAPISPKAEIVCGEIGLSLAGRTRQLLKEELIKPSTLFVALEDEHRAYLMGHFGVPEERIVVLQDGITNPRFGDLDAYRSCRDQIVLGVDDLLNHLIKLEKDRVRLYFVRHAESDLTIREDAIRPLTPKGLRDTRKVTAALQDKGITKIYSSPYLRAVDTVLDLAETLGLEIVKMNDLGERAVGGWVEDFHAFSQRQWDDFSHKNPGGESLAEVQERNIRAVKAIIQDNLGSSVAVGTHGTALSTILNYFDPTFGYDDFHKIIDKMPYILCFTFDQDKLVSIMEIEGV
jgi:2,3-bisphosphoglycerate-dependent phosphoglycerate mutase